MLAMTDYNPWQGKEEYQNKLVHGPCDESRGRGLVRSLNHKTHAKTFTSDTNFV